MVFYTKSRFSGERIIKLGFNMMKPDELANLARQKQDLEKSKIEDIIRRRNLNKLYHFTSMENFKSIIRHGIAGKNFLTKNGIEFQITDNSSLQFLKDAIFFSLSNPNDYMRYTKRMSGMKLIVAEISELSSIIEIFCEVPFVATPTNSSNLQIQKLFGSNPELFLGYTGLKNLFQKESVRELFALDLKEPTDPQSEIIFLQKLPSHFITRWHVPVRYYEAFVDLNGDYINVHKDFKMSQFDSYDGKKAREQRDFRSWDITWIS